MQLEMLLITALSPTLDFLAPLITLFWSVQNLEESSFSGMQSPLCYSRLRKTITIMCSAFMLVCKSGSLARQLFASKSPSFN
jgi:hypothetical protein